jgi:hypothetical protein
MLHRISRASALALVTLPALIIVLTISLALVPTLMTAVPSAASTDAKRDAQAVADKFIAAFVAGNLETTTALYSPDAMFWGTVSPELGISPDVLRKYFADNYAARANVPLVSASITDSSALVLSDDTVVIAGRWQTERPTGLSPLRFTMVMHKKGGQWQIVHLHSSPRPKQ